MDNGYNLHIEILESKGMQYLNRMRLHGFTYNIYSMNLHEITEGLQAIENPDIGLKLMSEENKDAGTQAFREINRLFHNLLASAKTLIEHTRIFINNHYSNTSISQAYEQKIMNEIANDELCKFIQDLRNYMLHQGLPHTEMSLNIENNGSKKPVTIESTISLDRDKLLNWNRWSSKSKSFLSNQPEKIHLYEIVSNYSDKINDLYSWLNQRIEKYHKKDLEELKSLQHKLKAVENA